MTRHRPRPILRMAVVIAALFVVVWLCGCASAPTSWPASRTELWPDSALPCDPRCQT